MEEIRNGRRGKEIWRRKPESKQTKVWPLLLGARSCLELWVTFCTCYSLTSSHLSKKNLQPERVKSSMCFLENT